jgi:glucokinase
VRRVLAADIGGTNARFAVFSLSGDSCSASGLELERVVWLPTEELTDAVSVLAAFDRALNTPPEAAVALVIALAGPVDGARGSLTNGFLHLDLTEARSAAPILLLNDFLAQAYACASRPGQMARPVLVPRGVRASGGTRAVVGAGTGLGAAVLYGSGEELLPLPSEAGHADFPFAGEEENCFHDFLRQQTGLPRAVGDVVLSGRGLALLHLFLTGERLHPREVSEAALGGDTPTLRWYSRLYGRFCRNMALTTLCAGGLWIAGGIAADNPLVVFGKSFAEEFYASPRFEALLRAVPVYLMDDGNSGLWGAASAACLRLAAHSR